jgi:hypothetical protein
MTKMEAPTKGTFNGMTTNTTNSTPNSTTTRSAADFDFLPGRWNVLHRRLQRRLQGCTEWDSFSGTTQAWPLLGGLGNVDDNWLDLPTGPYRAVSLRAFDLQTQQWSIWWLDGRNPTGLDTPVRGAFTDGVGRFYADDTLDGRPVRVRFLWSDITADRARWEQAFSPDGGRSWEANWTMDFQRTA